MTPAQRERRQLVILPIEDLEERYSMQWNRWWLAELAAAKISYLFIHPKPLSTKIDTGEFLDVAGTCHFKAMQLARLAHYAKIGALHDGDVILFHDAWFPGLEMVAYLKSCLGLKLTVAGFLHAGTWDKYDFLSQKGVAVWSRPFEQGWLDLLDHVFVATKYHYELITETLSLSAHKVVRVSWPFYPDTFVPKPLKPLAERPKRIVFPHRLASEKQPEVFDALAERMRDKLPGWEFVKTKDVCKTKSDYYNLLGESRIAVSCALQETFGIAMVEAVLCGCIPLVPARLSYSELYPRGFQYYEFYVDGKAPGMSLDDRLLDIISWHEVDKRAAHALRERFTVRGESSIPIVLEALGF